MSDDIGRIVEPGLILTPALEAEVTPPCDYRVDVVVGEPHGVHRTIGREFCNFPAEKILRTECMCGLRLVLLFCTPHAAGFGYDNHWQCGACGALDELVSWSVTHLTDRK